MVKKMATKTIGWLATTKLLQGPRKKFKKVLFDVMYAKYGQLIFVNSMVDIKAIYNPEILVVKDLVKKIKSETTMLLFDVETFQLSRAVTQTSKIKGEIAEVGVFRGGSAKLICEAKGNKKLHLFDTFEGLPPLSAADNINQFHEKQFSSSFDEVKNYLKDYSNVYFYKGLFPATAAPIANERFSFVHIDVDLYEATLDCLQFFYPRMNKGAILISHDYVIAPGVRKAFDEFFADKPEPIIEIEISGSQCLVVKT